MLVSFRFLANVSSCLVLKAAGVWPQHLDGDLLGAGLIEEDVLIALLMLARVFKATSLGCACLLDQQAGNCRQAQNCNHSSQWIGVRSSWPHQPHWCVRFNRQKVLMYKEPPPNKPSMQPNASPQRALITEPQQSQDQAQKK